MYQIKLDKRLSLVASFIRENSTVADIGTDHAYLPAYLVKNNICKNAIASDVNEKPLENAKETIKAANLEGKIKTVLSNGLEQLEQNCADDIVLAGMGGELIAKILENVNWIRRKEVRIIAQPMTHAEILRQFFINNDFVIEKEAACSDSKHTYCVMSAHYDGTKRKYSDSYIYYGELIKNKDADSIKFLKKQYSQLEIKYNALSRITDDENTKKLKLIFDDFKMHLGDD